jgi:glycosyltransferase involved in cell wall biosynthesis
MPVINAFLVIIKVSSTFLQIPIVAEWNTYFTDDVYIKKALSCKIHLVIKKSIDDKLKKRRPLRILFDANPLVSPSQTGISRTARGLIVALSNEFPDEIELIGHYFASYSKNSEIDLPAAKNIRYKKTSIVSRRMVNMLRRLGFYVPFEILVKERGDFLLFPDFVGWPSFYKTPSAPFIHDLTYLDLPDYVDKVNLYDLTKLVPKTISRASFVITNSEASKKRIIKAYNPIDKKILVEHIPLVNALAISSDEALKKTTKLGIKGKYIYFLGTLEPRKNLIGLLEAYGKLSTSFQNSYSLVISGGKGWNDSDITNKIDDLKSQGLNIVITGYVSDEERAALFARASLYVMPSFYEGFGMQLLEAMFYKTPMLVSDIPVLREVAGNAAVYSKTDPNSIREGIENILKDSANQKTIVRYGETRLRDFTWKKVANEVYDEICRSVDIKQR